MGEILIFSVEPLSDPSETSATQQRIKKKKKRKTRCSTRALAAQGPGFSFPTWLHRAFTFWGWRIGGGGEGGGVACGLSVRDGISVTVLVTSCWITQEALQRRDQDLKSEFCSISTEEYHTAKREERLLAAWEQYIIQSITIFITLDASDLGELFFILAYWIYWEAAVSVFICI